VPLWSLGERGAEPGRFEQPKDVALSPDGDTLYVADTGNHRIQAFSRNGVFRFAFGGYGQKAGQFRAPSCVTVAPDGEVLVCDTGNNRIQAFSPGGRWRATRVPGDGSGLNQPYGVAALPDGVLVVVDTYRHGLAWLRSDGTVLARFGGFGDGAGRFAYPLGVAHDGARDRLFVADANNARVVVVGWAPLP
jgi:DNA-binding beta-propeller fold protein YncE